MRINEIIRDLNDARFTIGTLRQEVYVRSCAQITAINYAIKILQGKLEQEEQQNKWIECTEQMPFGDCFVYEANSKRVLAAYHSEWEADDWNVTHWQPLRVCEECGEPMFRSDEFPCPFYEHWTCCGVERHKITIHRPFPTPPKEILPKQEDRYGLRIL